MASGLSGQSIQVVLHVARMRRREPNRGTEPAATRSPQTEVWPARRRAL
jgi:hypothetical protein